MFKLCIFMIVILFLIQFSSATCIITPSLINQDPISAVPGETVKLLFQLTGIENPECGIVSLEFVEEYPFSLEPGFSKIQNIKSGTYTRDFNSFWMVPYKVRVDSKALDGDQLLRLKTWTNNNFQLVKIADFNISIKEVRTDFIITLDSYSFSTNKLVLGVVNVGKKRAQSITVEIIVQDNALIEGGNVKILGELDSNEDTTVIFDAILDSGPIKINLEYNDEIGERRILTKEVLFSGFAFENTREKSSVSIGSIFLWLIIGGIIIYLYVSRRKAHAHIKQLKKNNHS